MPTSLSPATRLTFARPDIAAAGLEGHVRAARFVEPKPFVCALPSTSLKAAPGANTEQMTRLLYGESFEVLDRKDGWAFGQASRDRYVGYVEESALATPGPAPTHWVSALRAYAFAEANLKTPVQALLSMNSLVAVEAEDGRFAKTAAGWIFKGHLTPIGTYRDDPAAVALEFLGAPYYWGGRESLGLDCSGLVQNALHACGVSCPRDSDMQEAELGEDVDPAALQRGDILFWQGHVAMMVEPKLMVHANGHHMAVALEGLDEAIARIEAAGSGPPTAYRRIRRP